MKSIVKLNEFFSASIRILEGADRVIMGARKQQNYLGISKGKGTDVYTLADLHIQNTVKYNLEQLFPRATIIGEEDEVEGSAPDTGDPYIWPDQINMGEISQKLLQSCYTRHKSSYREYLAEIETIHRQKTSEAAWNYFDFPDEFYEEDMVIWIDPLDGTQGFVDGHLNHITSMIGLAIGGRPRVGIIHKPFYA